MEQLPPLQQPKKKNKWLRRFRIYFTAFGISAIVCYFTLWRGKDFGFLPSHRVKAFIANAKKINVDSTLLVKMNCAGFSIDDIRKSAMSGDVDFDKSQPRKEPCHEYDVTMNVKGKQLEIYFSACMDDSIATILQFYPPLNACK